MIHLFKKDQKTDTHRHLAEEARLILKALGGANNIQKVEACITRLRINVNDLKKVDRKTLKALGAVDVVEVAGSVQAIFGLKSAEYRDAINQLLAS